MKCYHMTKIDNLDSISKLGLIPRNGDNSKLIHDDKIKVFFSEGYEGAIALYVDFSIVYHQVKKKEIILNDDYLTNKIMSSKNLEDYLEDGVYLSFDMNGITNERNFENGCTSQVIEPENLNVLVLKNMETNEVSYSRFNLIHYMMSTVSPTQIKYYGVIYSNSPSFEEATKRIQNKVKRYYDYNRNVIDKFKMNHYEVEEIPLKTFLNEKCKVHLL